MTALRSAAPVAARSAPVPVTGLGVVVAGVTALSDLSPAPGGALAPAGADWFDPVRHLGRRGWKYLTPATRYLLAAGALARGPRPGGAGTGATDGLHADRTGVCTGTSDAIDALHAELDRIVRTEGIGGLSPAQLPGFSVNIPASQLAIATAARAFSVTLTNPGVAGLEAVLFGMAAIRAGRAEEVLATATEQGGTGLSRGGAVALRLGGAATAPAARVLGGITRFMPAGVDGGPAVAARAVAALVEPHAGPVRLAVSGPDAVAVGAAVAAELAAAGVGVVPVHHLGAAGEYGTVSGLLQVAGLLGAAGVGLAVAGSGLGHLAAVALLVDRPITELAPPITN